MLIGYESIFSYKLDIDQIRSDLETEFIKWIVNIKYERDFGRRDNVIDFLNKELFDKGIQIYITGMVFTFLSE